MPRAKSPIDADIIRELAQVLTETDLTEIEVQQADLRIRVARQLQLTATVASAPAMMAAPAMPAMTSPAQAAAPTAEAVADLDNHPGALKSPMVGTAYRGAAPGAKPFVDVGAKVAQGERVLIVEAMKTFNDILAPKGGTITAILIDDKSPVEFGQVLMIIE